MKKILFILFMTTATPSHALEEPILYARCFSTYTELTKMLESPSSPAQLDQLNEMKAKQKYAFDNLLKCKLSKKQLNKMLDQAALENSNNPAGSEKLCDQLFGFKPSFE
jgi:hypothetical protein